MKRFTKTMAALGLAAVMGTGSAFISLADVTTSVNPVATSRKSGWVDVQNHWYYFDAKTYDPEFSMISPEGKKPDFCRWAGGWQTYICASQSPLYLRRNFTELFRQGIQLEGTYLDVFYLQRAG